MDHLVVSPSACDPDSDESLSSLIDLAQRSAIGEEKSARYLTDKIARIREAATWPRRVSGEPKSWDRFCREVIGYDAGYLATVERGVNLLDSLGVRDASVEQAHQAGSVSQRVVDAAKATTGEVRGKADNQHVQIAHAPLPTSDRAANAGVSVRTQRKLDAIARKAPEQLERIRQGEVSVHRACVEAGIVRMPTPLEQIRRLVPKLTPDERAELVSFVIDFKE